MVQVVRVGHNDRNVRLLPVNQASLELLHLLGALILQRGHSSVFFRVVIATLQVSLALVQFLVRVLLFSVVTKDSLVHHRVKNLLFPSVVTTTI